MVDEDKKPRHRLGADELLEETHGAVGKILNLLQSNGLAAESVEHLTTLAKGVDFMVSYCILWTTNQWCTREIEVRCASAGF